MFTTLLLLPAARMPDAMVAFGRPQGDRGSYLQWREDGIAPQVVFEILSPGSRVVDRSLKFERYERAGTPAYWLADPDVLTLTAYELREGRFELVAQVSGQEFWTATVPYEVTITPGAWLD